MHKQDAKVASTAALLCICYCVAFSVSIMCWPQTVYMQHVKARHHIMITPKQSVLFRHASQNRPTPLL